MGGFEVSRHGSVRLAGASLAVALLLAGCGSEVAGSSGPPLLRIGTGTVEAAAGLGAPAADAGGTASAGGPQDPYPLEGTLPSGPSSATVWRYAATAVARSDVVALAAAVGVSAAPVRHAHGWVVTSGAASLRVRDGAGTWSFARDSSTCAPYAVDVDNPEGVTSGVGCAVAGHAVAVPAPASPPSARPAPTPSSAPPGTTAPPTEPSSVPPGTTAPPTEPSEAAALTAARPLLSALGLTTALVRVLPGETGPGMRTVVVDPVVGGEPTSGLRTLIEVDRTGVVAAAGVLGTPTRGDAYPIVTAAAALDLLRAVPQPEIAMACAIGRVCPGLEPRVVTGARLGLTMADDAGAPVLVPAWLFSIKGSDDPAAVVAVERRYLADPAPPPDASTAPTAGSGAGSGSGGVLPAPQGSTGVDGGTGAATGSAVPANVGSGDAGSPVPPPGSGSGTIVPADAVPPIGTPPSPSR